MSLPSEITFAIIGVSISVTLKILDSKKQTLSEISTVKFPILLIVILLVIAPVLQK